MGYRGGKSCFSCERGSKEKDKKRTNPQTNNQSAPRRKKLGEEQHRVNKEKNNNTQREEKKITGSEKISEGAIRNIRKQEECPLTETINGTRCSKKRGT